MSKVKEISSKSSVKERVNFVRAFYPTCSSLLDNALTNLGYELAGVESYGLNEVKVYIKDGKFVEHGYKGLKMYTLGPKGNEIVRYSGKVVEKNMLEDFTNSNRKNKE